MNPLKIENEWKIHIDKILQKYLFQNKAFKKLNFKNQSFSKSRTQIKISVEIGQTLMHFSQIFNVFKF